MIEGILYRGERVPYSPDVVVGYGGGQLTEYLDYFHRTKGYMLSFNFNKNKQVGVKTIELDGRTIVEAVV